MGKPYSACAIVETRFRPPISREYHHISAAISREKAADSAV